MSSVINDVIERHKVLPVIAIPNRECILPLGDALVKGKLPIAEITFRTSFAEEAIQLLSKTKGLTVGAGTVLNKTQAETAINAGAKFIVSPGFSDEVVSYCLEKKVMVYPGVITPTEIQRALQYGLDVLKFFPAESFGGINTIKSYEGPFAKVKFIPTGGVSLLNLVKYLASKNVLACGGTWIAPLNLLETCNIIQVQQNIEQTVKLVEKI